MEDFNINVLVCSIALCFCNHGDEKPVFLHLSLSATDGCGQIKSKFLDIVPMSEAVVLITGWVSVVT